MREAGFIHCTPDNVGDYDEYDINAAMMMSEIDADPQLKRAREHARKRKEGKVPKRGKGNKRTGGQGNHLSLIQ